MKADPRTPAELEAGREKTGVALSSVMAAVFLTAFKAVVGVSTGSLGILSEAAHSGLDLVAAIVTLFAVRASARPADPEHTYGHGKVENLSALLETLLLFVTCVWIIYEAVVRLFLREVEVKATTWAFLVVGISMVVDYTRSRALMKAARKYHSQALEADALHFSTDIWSSAVVFLGLILVRIAQSAGPAWLAHADAVAALGVAGIVIQVSYRLGRRTVDDLLDAVSPALRADIINVAQVAGVFEVRRARMRKSGGAFFVDLTLSVDRSTSLERAHDIATEAEWAVRSILPGADVVVHVDPVAGGEEGILSTIRLLAARAGLGVHGIRIHDVHGQYSLEMHLEANEGLQVGEAHHLATTFEASLHQALPWIDSIITHLEPLGDFSATLLASPAEEEQVTRTLNALAREIKVDFHPHEIRVRRVGQRLSLGFHCSVDAAVTLTDAHAFTDRLEALLRERIPDLARVVIHIEPSDEAAGPVDEHPTDTGRDPARK
jgi:cation diffusion facilitator family transporter